MRWLFVFSLLLLASCSAPAYDELSQKADTTDEYGVIYDWSMFMAGVGNLKMGVFKKGDMSKMAMEVNMMGEHMTYSIYHLNETIACEKSSYSDGYDCQEEDSSEYAVFMDLIRAENATEPKYIGRENVVGRMCHKYHLKPGNTEVTEELLYYGLGNNTYLETCLDSSTGIPLQMAYKTTTRSELTGEMEEQEVISFTATKFQSSVDDSIFELPTQ